MSVSSDGMQQAAHEVRGDKIETLMKIIKEEHPVVYVAVRLNGEDVSWIPADRIGVIWGLRRIEAKPNVRVSFEYNAAPNILFLGMERTP